MQNRRIFLKSIAPLAAAVALPKIAEASKENNLEDACQFHADKLAEAMREMYGGNWEIALSATSIFGRRYV